MFPVCYYNQYIYIYISQLQNMFIFNRLFICRNGTNYYFLNPKSNNFKL